MKHAFYENEKAVTANESRDYCPFIPVFGPPAVMFERGEGTQLWDISGKRYLDFLSGIAVVSLGHANPVIAKAIAEQANTLVHVSNFFANTVATKTAVELSGLMRDAGAGDGQVFFCNSGAEANEAAIKLARKFGGRGRHRIVTALGSFHGRTLGALALTGQPAKHEVFQPMPEGFKYCEFGDIASLEAQLDDTVAAVMLEPIQGEGGVVPADAAYLQAVQKLCNERGILLIIDEVQTGFCRTGKWFGFEHAGIQPDAITMAKGMGNGMPVGALWARKDIASVLQPGDHGSTYSGTALATSAVSAVISEMKRLDAASLANKQGARLREGLLRLAKVDHVRGSGLLLGAQLVEGVLTADVVPVLLDAGLIVNGVNATTIRFAPPLTVSDAEIDEALSILATVLS
jgi:predicted acetylornithine/succinylornithine family transaminase